MKLYALAEQYEQLLAEIDDNDGVVDGDLEVRLDEIGGQLVEKTEACAAVVRALDAQATALKLEEARLAKRRKAFESRSDQVTAYIGTCLRVAGQTRVKGTLFTVALQTNPPAVRLLVPDDEVPLEYVQTKVVNSIDRVAIKAAIVALHEGESLGFADLVRSEKVVIR